MAQPPLGVILTGGRATRLRGCTNMTFEADRHGSSLAAGQHQRASTPVSVILGRGGRERFASGPVGHGSTSAQDKLVAVLGLMQENLGKLVLTEMRGVVREHDKIVSGLADTAAKIFHARRIEFAGLLVSRGVVARVVRENAMGVNQAAHIEQPAWAQARQTRERRTRRPSCSGRQSRRAPTTERSGRQEDPEQQSAA